MKTYTCRISPLPSARNPRDTNLSPPHSRALLQPTLRVPIKRHRLAPRSSSGFPLYNFPAATFAAPINGAFSFSTT
jgi:hypothetical protein